MSDRQGMHEGSADQPMKPPPHGLKPKVSLEEQEWGTMAALDCSLGSPDRPLSLAAAESEVVRQEDTSSMEFEGDGMDQASGVSATPSTDELETSVVPAMVVEEEVGSADSFEETVRLLATHSQLGYEQVRKDEAKRLGVRTSFLDQMVNDARQAVGPAEPMDQICQIIEPWPEPVNAAQVLEEILTTIMMFIVCADATAIRAALFIIFTWFVDVFDLAPIAIITSPRPRCGKSTLLLIIGKLSRHPLLTSNLTGAAIFQSIEAYHPTLLIDETDSFLKEKEQIRGLINSGHTRATGFVLRAGQKDGIPRKYSTFCAKVLCGIGKLAETILDRAVLLKLRRKLKEEKVQRLRYADKYHFITLARKLARLANDHGASICNARPQIPEQLNDRAQDNWEPLLAIAELAGEEWAQKAREAALSSVDEDKESDASVMLLNDIKHVFDRISFEIIGGKPVKRIQTKNLLFKLAADDTQPWATANHGSPMTARQLAEYLEPFGIKSADNKWAGGKVQKGFRLDQFEDAFARYISAKAEGVSEQEQEDADAHPSTRYSATSEFACGSTDFEPVAVADAVQLLPRNEGVEEAVDAATCDLPNASESASILEGSEVAAESDSLSNDAGADSPCAPDSIGGALASEAHPRLRGRPRKVPPQNLPETE